MLAITLTRDVVAPFTKTAYPADLPAFDENKIDSVALYSPWIGPVPLTVAAYSAADWGDGAKPDPGEIMFSEADRQWKANQWVLGPFGDILELVVRPYNERAPEP
jgi:hypothetical protein